MYHVSRLKPDPYPLNVTFAIQLQLPSFAQVRDLSIFRANKLGTTTCMLSALPIVPETWTRSSIAHRQRTFKGALRSFSAVLRRDRVPATLVDRTQSDRLVAHFAAY
jgi:hypothetical protein